MIKNFSNEDIKKFNLNHAEDFFNQIILNKKKKINTWAIFWYATLFKKNGLCLNPAQTFLENIGLDSSGTSPGNNMFKNYDNISLIKKINFINNISENQIAVNRIINFFKDNNNKSIFERIVNNIKRKFGLN